MLRTVFVAANLRQGTTSQDLSSAVLNFTTSIKKPFRLLQVLLHASTGITETATIKLNSRNGANYDTILAAGDFDGNQDLSFVAGDNMVGPFCMPNDEIDIDVTADNSTGIVYVTYVYEEIQ